MLELSDQDILTRLTNTEDSTVERKVANDIWDCLKTAVAFSNSLPVNDPGIIFVGVGNDGTVQENYNCESLQTKISKALNEIYPPIYVQMKVMQNAKGMEFVAVIVRGSLNRPHFAGPSYVRDGHQSVVASEEMFEQLIAERNSKVRYILRWKGKEITYRYLEPFITNQKQGILTECNQHFIVIDNARSIPLDCVLISSDTSKNQLRLDFEYAGS